MPLHLHKIIANYGLVYQNLWLSKFNKFDKQCPAIVKIASNSKLNFMDAPKIERKISRAALNVEINNNNNKILHEHS